MSIADLIAAAKKSPARGRGNIPDDKPTPRQWEGQNALPTAEEIAEGTAYIALRNAPDSKEAQRAHCFAWNAMQQAQKGNTGCVRCENCGVIRYGRPRFVPCGHCNTPYPPDRDFLARIELETLVHGNPAKTARLLQAIRGNGKANPVETQDAEEGEEVNA